MGPLVTPPWFTGPDRLVTTQGPLTLVGPNWFRPPNQGRPVCLPNPGNLESPGERKRKLPGTQRTKDQVWLPGNVPWEAGPRNFPPVTGFQVPDRTIRSKKAPNCPAWNSPGVNPIGWAPAKFPGENLGNGNSQGRFRGIGPPRFPGGIPLGKVHWNRFRTTGKFPFGPFFSLGNNPKQGSGNRPGNSRVVACQIRNQAARSFPMTRRSEERLLAPTRQTDQHFRSSDKRAGSPRLVGSDVMSLPMATHGPADRAVDAASPRRRDC